jgi:DNA primase large subunit
VQASNTRFVEVFKEFFRKWWSGPSKMAAGALREIGICVGALKRDPFKRELGNLSVAFAIIPFKDFRQLNLFISIAFYPDVDLPAPDKKKALYDRLFYDFDLSGDPELAKKKALEFAQSIKARFKVDPVVVVSGLHGAHIHIPLKKPITWQVYEALWSALMAPYSFGRLVDPQVKEASRLHRVPYTYNIKYEKEEDKVYEGFSYIADLSGKRIRMEDFDWGGYEPLDPSSIELYEFSAVDLPQIKVVVASRPRVSKAVVSKSKLPEDPAALDSHDAAPPCIRNIIQALKTSGDPDHNQRLALVWFLKWVGYSVDAVVDLFKRFAKDFNEKVTRYQVEYAFGLRGKREEWLPPTCEWMKQHSICLSCGWGEKHRNIVTYTYARAEVPEVLKQKFFELVSKRSSTNNTTSIDTESEQLRIPQELQAFLRESGFREFSYGDAKEWIEKRFGPIDASKWHSIERTLRQLAEKCILGRKFLVDGDWVDYGCGKIEKPPSKEVRFYVVKDLSLLSS